MLKKNNSNSKTSKNNQNIQSEEDEEEENKDKHITELIFIITIISFIVCFAMITLSYNSKNVNDLETSIDSIYKEMEGLNKYVNNLEKKSKYTNEYLSEFLNEHHLVKCSDFDENNTTKTIQEIFEEGDGKIKYADYDINELLVTFPLRYNLKSSNVSNENSEDSEDYKVKFSYDHTMNAGINAPGNFSVKLENVEKYEGKLCFLVAATKKKKKESENTI